MKFKLDENIGRKAEQMLRDAGHDVSTVTLQSLNGTSDENLFQVCIAEQRTLVTLDHDLHELGSELWIIEPGRVRIHQSPDV